MLLIVNVLVKEMLVNSDKDFFNKIKQNIVDDWLMGRISDTYFEGEIKLERLFRE